MKKNPHDFAIELRDHLKIRDSMVDLEPSVALNLSNLNQIEDEIHSSSIHIDRVKTQIEQYKKDYQIFNFRYGLGESHSDFPETKKLRSDTWELLANAEKERDDIYSQIRELRGQRDELSREVGHLRRKIKATSDFFKSLEDRTTLFSIVTLELNSDKFTFQLLTEDQRSKAWNVEIDSYAVESPIGRACLNKRTGEEISYVAPNGSTLNGSILEFSLPTLDQMEKLIGSLESKHTFHSNDEVNPFYLQDMYGTNNSRRRKGG